MKTHTKKLVKNVIQLSLLLTLMPLSQAYASDRIVSCYKHELHSINADGSNFKKLTDYKVPGHAPTCKSPSQTADQSEIFWSYDPEFHGGMSLFKFNGKNDKDVVRLTPKPRKKDAGTWDSSVSPSGKYSTFAADRNGHWQIYKITTASKKIENISQTNTDAAYPKWSPDDSQIVYVEFGKDEVAKLYVMNADGSNKHALVADGNVNKNPAWSPNGKTIAYTVHNGRKAQLWTVDLATKQKRLVTKDLEQYTSVSWSKNSDQLVYVASNKRLSIINVNGSGKSTVSNKTGFYEPFWH